MTQQTAEEAMSSMAGHQIELKQYSIEMKDDPKSQRMTRAAHKRREKEQQKEQETPISYAIDSEQVGGAKPKRSVTADLQGALCRFTAMKDGKVPDVEH